MRFKMIWCAAAVSAVLSGCSAGSVSVVENQQGGLFLPGEYAYDASRGDIPVVVIGNAFGLDARTFADAVVGKMQASDWPPHARFVAASSPETAHIYWYAMMFGSSGEATSLALCANPRQFSSRAAPAPTDNAIVLITALCRYDKAATGVTARGAAQSVDDPQFHALILGAVQELTRPNQGRTRG